MTREPIKIETLTMRQKDALLKHFELRDNTIIGGVGRLLLDLDEEVMSPESAEKISWFAQDLGGALVMSNAEIDSILASTHDPVSYEAQ
jgi:hypothetical protein